MHYRVRQFFRALTAKLSVEDKSFIKEYLNEREEELFFALPIYEQAHSVRVARVLQSSLSQDCRNYDILIKAGLLHDIGKLHGGLNLVNKPIMVILDHGMPKLLKRLQGIKAVDTYYNHPQKALTHLENEDPYLVYLIQNHHNYSISNLDEGLKKLQQADSRN